MGKRRRRRERDGEKTKINEFKLSQYNMTKKSVECTGKKSTRRNNKEEREGDIPWFSAD